MRSKPKSETKPKVVGESRPLGRPTVNEIRKTRLSGPVTGELIEDQMHLVEMLTHLTEQTAQVLSYQANRVSQVGHAITNEEVAKLSAAIDALYVAAGEVRRKIRQRLMEKAHEDMSRSSE